MTDSVRQPAIGLIVLICQKMIADTLDDYAMTRYSLCCWLSPGMKINGNLQVVFKRIRSDAAFKAALPWRRTASIAVKGCLRSHPVVVNVIVDKSTS